MLVALFWTGFILQMFQALPINIIKQKPFTYAASLWHNHAVPQHKPSTQAGWMECCVAIKSHASSICLVRLWLAFGASTVNH